MDSYLSLDKEINMAEPLFVPADFFLVRTPILPIDAFWELASQPDMEPLLLSIYERNPLLREAIAIASPSLHTALAKKNKDAKEARQSVSALLKYYTRMSTRPTPFGLFSSVSLGTWGEKTRGSFTLDQLKKRARPDMEWLFGLIDTYAKDPLLFPFLPVRANPLISQYGGRVILNHLRKKEKGEEDKTISIRATPLVLALLEVAEHSISVTALINKLVEKMPFLEEERVMDVIRTLLEHQILNLDVCPSLLTTSPFQDLMQKMQGLEPLAAQHKSLTEVAELIDAYNHLPVGEGEECLQQITTALQPFANATTMVQVDSGTCSDQLELGSRIKSQLQEASEFLWYISPKDAGARPLQGYYTRFLDRFGLLRTIPVLDLLNEETGLGIPEEYIQQEARSLTPDTPFEKWLKLALFDALQQGIDEIIIPANWRSLFFENVDRSKALPGFDLFFELLSDTPENIDKGNYLIALTSLSLQSGSTFGRFIDLFGDELKERLRLVMAAEETTLKHMIFVESSYIPQSSRSANVAIHTSLRSHCIDLATSKIDNLHLDLREIYVGATQSHLYLTDRDGKREFCIVSGNVLNPAFAPLPLRFIRDVTLSQHHLIFPFGWKGLDWAPYLPRVRIENVILSPAQWKLKADSKKEMKEMFLSWAKKLEIPRYVYLSVFDQKLLLDLHHPVHLQEIVDKLTKGEEIILQEKIYQRGGQWLQSPAGIHHTEFVLPFVKHADLAKPTTHTPIAHSTVPASSRWKLPGGEWLYMNIYMSQTNAHRFLLQTLNPFVDELKQSQLILEWFFIRYSDPKFHLRVRLKCELHHQAEVIEKMHTWISNSFHESLTSHFSLGTYEREIERYGGEGVIDSAEGYFSGDSESALQLIRILQSKQLAMPNYVVAAISIIDLIKQFDLNLSNRPYLVGAGEDRKELEGYRTHRSILTSIGQALLEGTLPSQQDPAAELINTALEARRSKQAIYQAALLENLPLADHHWYRESICDSCIHMLCNRLLGLDPMLEKKARLFAHQALSDRESHRRQLAPNEIATINS